MSFTANSFSKIKLSANSAIRKHNLKNKITFKYKINSEHFKI